jgi:DNA helicase-2/ATP-dependent DNA helicase PcrA
MTFAKAGSLQSALNGKSQEKQLDVIFSAADKILVEAPAGYGKTNTMVSKIAYMLATQQIPNPKKILALTFSVNAAYKIKKTDPKKSVLIMEKSPKSTKRLLVGT